MDETAFLLDDLAFPVGGSTPLDYFALDDFAWAGVAVAEVPGPGPEWVVYDPGTEWAAPDPGSEWDAPDPGTEWDMASQPEVLSKKAAADRWYYINLYQWKELRAGEYLTGTPTLGAGGSGVTVAGITVSGAPPKKIAFRLTGGTPGGPYSLPWTALTNTGRTLADDVRLRVT